MNRKIEHVPGKIRVTKHDQRGDVIAMCEVDTIEQARKFLDTLNPDGTPKSGIRTKATT